MILGGGEVAEVIEISQHRRRASLSISRRAMHDVDASSQSLTI